MGGGGGKEWGGAWFLKFVPYFELQVNCNQIVGHVVDENWIAKLQAFANSRSNFKLSETMRMLKCNMHTEAHFQHLLNFRISVNKIFTIFTLLFYIFCAAGTLLIYNLVRKDSFHFSFCCCQSLFLYISFLSIKNMERLKLKYSVE